MYKLQQNSVQRLSDGASIPFADEILNTPLEYCGFTGNFYWTKDSSNYRKGQIAGDIHHKHGYVRIGIKGKKYLAHRLAWLFVFGYFPKYIDHINGITSDNRIENLREVTSLDNAKNRCVSSNNNSGVIGVYFKKDRNKWVARIEVEGNKIHLGSFVEFHEAVNARKNAEVLYGFHKNHGRK